MTRWRPAVRWHSWLVRALGPFVPRARRLDWMREWEAELESRERELLEWGLVPRRASWRVFREGTGAVWDALCLQSARWEDEVIQDIRFGFRLLRRSPWLSSTAIASLAIGIGATTAVFTVINAALLKALPYPAVERLIAVTQGGTRYFSLPEYRELHAGVTTLEHLSAVETRDFVMGGGDSHPEQVRGQRVSASFVTLVGLDSTLAPVLGRVFAGPDFEPGRQSSVLISQRLWQRRFASDQAVVGRAITLDAVPATIVGVLPASFDLFPSSDVLLPLLPTRVARNDRLYRYLEVLGRLPAGTVPARAEAEVTALASRGDDPQPVSVVFLRELLMQDVRRTLLTMWVMAGLVLMAACLNFANLLTARATARQQELIVRVSLGGRRLRLARQLVIEALVLVVIGGGIGLLLAHFGAGVLVAALPQPFLGSGGVGIDARVMGFALLASIVCGVVFAALPALNVSAGAERAGSRLSVGTWRTHPPAARRVYTVLSSIQVALTLALLVGAALFVKSFWQLAKIEPGYQAREAVTLQFDLPAIDYPDAARVVRLTDAIDRGLRTLPGVRGVGQTSNLPLVSDGMEYRSFAVENGPLDVGPPEAEPPGLAPPPPPPPPPTGAAVSALRYFQAVHVLVGPGFFDTMGIPLAAGRDFTSSDRSGTQLVTIVNRAFADRYFPDADPIGRHIRLSPVTPWMTVVGVVANTRRFARDDAHRAEFYRPFAQADIVRASDGPGARVVTSVMFVVRTSRGPEDVARSTRGILARVDAALPIAQVATLQGAIDDSVAQQRLMLRLFLAFAAATLIVAAVGVYGVTTYLVSRRQHEMAVRVALGARPSSIEALVVGESLPVMVLGLTLGLWMSAALARYVGQYLFRVSPLDGWVYVAMAAILAFVVAAASYLPARRAGRTDPLIALKGL